MAKRSKYDGITPDLKNANKGTERGRYMVEASLRETGAGRSILLDRDGRIIAGNKTFEAASDIGLPVRVVETDGRELVAVKRTDLDLSDDTGTARKLAYYDNRSGQVGLEWDAEVLLEDIGAGLDLSAMFRQDELDELLADLTPKTEGDTPAQIDRAEELLQKWGTAAGQLWQLGEHRLIVGDCTDAATVARVMGGERADTLVSDPPYGIGYEYTDHDDSDNVQNEDLIKRAWQLAPVARVWTCGLMNLKRDLAWNPDAKVLCWHKGFAQAGNGLGGASTWEPVLVVGVRKDGTLPDDYLHFGTDRIEGLRDLHSCPKPVALFEHLIKHLAGAIVYEPFSGSGTTIIACENLGRRCRAVEISAAYVAVALQRYQDHTQRTPVLLTS